LGHLIFVGGGARSGKSALALRIASTHGPRRVFLATAQAFDKEMRDRIDRHQAEREERYRTIEEPLAVPEAVRSVTDCDVLLLDCITLWMSNLLLAEVSDIQPRVHSLITAISDAPFDTIVVSNEVGQGIVPMNALARRFRDETGWAHQSLAAAADQVYYGALGMMLRLKPGPVEPVLS
jgi:adenosylcobinamide kinase/adenosylcobinamide-phosphate guanylyltransferase